MLLVVWWAWNYTTWVTNELDPDSIVVRLLLLGLMLASLLMAVAIPEAFGERALLFAGVVRRDPGRAAPVPDLRRRPSPGTIERERAARILIWLVGVGRLLARGRLSRTDSTRDVLWLVALAIDYVGAVGRLLGARPAAPRRTRPGTSRPSHFAERFQLFIIIALGESIVLTGATTAELDLDAARVAGFALAFLATAAMWWLYFNYVAAIAQRRLEPAPNRTLLARDGYTYLHVVMVAGIIVGAVGDELVIAHPTDVLPAAEVVVVAAGPAIYLLGHVLFRLGWPARSAGSGAAARSRASPIGVLGAGRAGARARRRCSSRCSSR